MPTDAERIAELEATVRELVEALEALRTAYIDALCPLVPISVDPRLDNEVVNAEVAIARAKEQRECRIEFSIAFDGDAYCATHDRHPSQCPSRAKGEKS